MLFYYYYIFFSSWIDRVYHFLSIQFQYWRAATKKRVYTHSYKNALIRAFARTVYIWSCWLYSPLSAKRYRQSKNHTKAGIRNIYRCIYTHAVYATSFYHTHHTRTHKNNAVSGVKCAIKLNVGYTGKERGEITNKCECVCERVFRLHTI